MRFSERDDISIPHNFLPRNRSGSVWKVIAGFSVALVVMLTLNLVPGLVGGEPEASLLSLVAISVLCFYIVFLKQKNLDLVLQTEFQNLLFAQAAAVGTLFCAFAKRDGTIVYANKQFYDLYSPSSTRQVTNVASMMHLMSVPQTAAEAVQACVFSLHVDSFSLHSMRENNTPLNLTLDIMPLTRPSGYVVMKAVATQAAHESEINDNAA